MVYRDGGVCAGVHLIMTLLVACILIVGVLSLAAAEPPPVPPQVVASSDPWAEYIAEAAERFEIPPRWIRAVMAAESGGDVNVRSPRGAMGLMQIMLATWAELRTKFALGDDPFEPRANILAGAALLRQMRDRYGAVDAMLAAYDAGAERYDAHLRTGRALPAETVAWLAKVAPMIGGEAPDRPAPAHGGESSWQRASLFVGRPAVTGGDHPADTDPLSVHPLNGRAIVDLSALVPLSDGLFVDKPAAKGERR